jgi:hypothetical protein
MPDAGGTPALPVAAGSRPMQAGRLRSRWRLEAARCRRDGGTPALPVAAPAANLRKVEVSGQTIDSVNSLPSGSNIAGRIGVLTRVSHPGSPVPPGMMNDEGPMTLRKINDE